MILLSLFLACSSSAPESEPQKTAIEEKAIQKEAPKKMEMTKMDHSKMDHSKMDHSKMVAVGEIPADARVFFITPTDGEKITGAVRVQMGVEGMNVRPAGEVVAKTGHHHIIIDADPIPKGMVVPADDQHKHFGKGQTETVLKLPAGKHKLGLQFANGVHASYGEQLATTIEIEVLPQQEQK